jgi:hypothetical protein
MGIQAKLKMCAGCNEPKHIWKSHGKDKYCKDCWYNIEKPKSIAPMSKKMKETVDQYSKMRTAYLVVNTFCKAKLAGCTANATEVHHKAGRGENHLRIATWLPVCRTCHTWIELHPKEAKELGLSETRL